MSKEETLKDITTAVRKTLDDYVMEERNLFNEWFTHILLSCETCLMRDVLRNQKENLFEEWMRVRPYG